MQDYFLQLPVGKPRGILLVAKGDEGTAFHHVMGHSKGAGEWGEFGVRVNAIAPGFILTDMTQKLWSNPTMHEWGKQNTPLGRLGEVEDMIGAAIFLASEASAFMTGQVVYVDGGFSAGICWPIDLDG